MVLCTEEEWFLLVLVADAVTFVVLEGVEVVEEIISRELFVFVGCCCNWTWWCWYTGGAGNKVGDGWG